MIDQPQPLAELVVSGIQDVLGSDGMARLSARVELAGWLNAPHRLTAPIASALQRHLEDEFSPAVGRGIIWRAGEAASLGLIRQDQAGAGFRDAGFRLQPFRKRASAGLEMLAAGCSAWFGSAVSLRSDDDHFIWRVEDCPWCWQRASDQPLCHFFAGFLSGYMGWVSGGRFFPVRESACCASGSAACEFVIDKYALE